MKLFLAVMMFSVLLLSNSFVQSSFGLGDYDFISEWGSFGIAQSGHFSYPQFIAVGDDGSIYVSDLGNKRVQKFSSNGEYITEWGKSGKQSGEFHYPSGIAVSDEFVFVADRDLNRIQKFSTDGEFIAEWGEKGKHNGQLYFPNGIAVNNGTVYVSDTGNQRIQMFSTDGEFISTFGSSGLGEGQFLTVVGIDIDADGNVYVTDKGNKKIEKFSATGEWIQSFAFYSPNYTFSPEAITVDSIGDMFIVNSANSRILHLSQDSNLNLNVFDQLGPYPKSFDFLSDIAIGINGELLIVDSANHKIHSFETEFYEKPVIIDSIEISDEVIEELPIDKTKPVIIAPISLEVEATDFLTTVSFGEATATDESGIKAIIHNAPDAFSIGVSTIIWVAFDNVGYSSSTSQTITVKTCGNIYSDYNVIEGTQGDDVIFGTDGDDLIFGLAGNDIISGGAGNDCIFGGHGDDIISGDDGDDTIRGNSGHDILKGESGIDVIYSNSGSDVIDGGADTDRCYPDSESDLLLNCEE
jgi:sugar lactone lactonase YvrE